MANPTTNYGFVMPTPTDLVTDLPADFEVFGQDVDSQMKTNADAATQKATLTTTGDIYYASSASTPARLGIGTNGQVLGSNGTTPTWVSTSGTTLISTTTLTGASVTLSSIPSGYNSLRVIVKNFLPATDNSTLHMQINGDTAARYTTQASSVSGAAGNTFNQTQLVPGVASDNAVATGMTIIDIPQYTDTTIWKSFIGYTYAADDATPTSVANDINRGFYNQTGAITSLLFKPSTGNFTSGTLLLYGVI